MIGTSRRTKIVSFRISEEELQELMSHCVSQGARSVSEFARKATLAHYQSCRTEESSQTVLDQIRRSLGSLDLEVQRLAGLIAGPQAAEASSKRAIDKVSNGGWAAQEASNA